MSTPGSPITHTAGESRFSFKSYPGAQQFLETHLSPFLVPPLQGGSLSPPFREMIDLRNASLECGLRFLDLIDHLRLAVVPSAKTFLEKQGFKPVPVRKLSGVLFQHPDALFPELILEEVKGEKAQGILEIALKVEDLDNLKKVRGYPGTIRGVKEGGLRKLSLDDSKGSSKVTFVERKGGKDFEEDLEGGRLEKIQETRELFGPHRDKEIRTLQDPDEGFRKTRDLIQEAIAQIGKDRAAYEWVRSEIRFWEGRNRAGKIQGEIQRSLGVGWANVDHITYRNSKEFYPKTIELLSLLGFQKREVLHAEEFTAQVMEHPALGTFAFVDVDPPQKTLGTVELWVRLHGESMLGAGLHHMAARYSFLKLQGALEKKGIRFRPPFSFFEDLKQAFSEGEKRRVSESHAKPLFESKKITPAQYREYTTQGALYTHLENIQRGNGFKGFNPHSVDKTLRDTGKGLRLKGNR